MSPLEAALLGVIQGITEWLPVSSTAHLILAEHLLGRGRGADALAFNVLVQWGTVLAVVAYFRRDFARIVRAVLAGLRARAPLGTPDARLGWWVALGTVPLVPVGLLLREHIGALHGRPVVVAWVLVGATPILFLGERLGSRRRALDAAGPGDALWIGLAQAVAVVPGVSRSAATIAGGMLRGFDREAAARFSFLLSVPALLAAGTVEAVELAASPGAAAAVAPLAVGFVAAAVTGYATIHLLLRHVRSRPLTDFAWYRLLAGGAMLLLLR